MNIDEFSFPNKPASFGKDYEFPEDLTKLPADNLGALISMLGAYRGYVLSLLARLEPKKKVAGQNYRLKLIEKTRSFDSERTLTAAKQKAELDPEVRDLLDSMGDFDSKSAFLQTLVLMYTGHIEVLSREISRRQMSRD